MKMIVLFLVCLAFLHSQLLPDHNKAAEIEKIEKALKDYGEGSTKGNFKQMSSAFHSSSTLKHAQKDGKFTEIDGETYLGFFKKERKINRKFKIISIDYSGRAAQSKIIFDYTDRKLVFIDYIQLLKIEGQWKIVNKIAEKYSSF